MRIVIGLLAVGLATTACGDQDVTVAIGSEARDSAGIRIVENARPPDGSRLGWRVDSVPTLSIGALEGEEAYLLHQVLTALKLSDGRIVVANRGSHELRVFDASGTHQGTWGGQGEGPGEFNSLLRVTQWPGDSLIAWYSQQDRLSIFDGNGNFSRTLRPGDPGNLVEEASPAGVILASRSSGEGLGPADADGLVRRERRYEVADAAGRLVASLGLHPDADLHVSASGDAFTFRTIPFTRSTRTATWGESVVVAPTRSYEIKAYDPGGVLSMVVRRAHALVAPTQAHQDADIERRVALRPPAEQAERRQELRERFAEVPMPETFPAFAAIVADALGSLWVQEYDLPGEERTNPLWTVFDPEGRVLGFVETPSGLRIYEIGEDYILGRATDDLGVEYVQVWSLDRAGG